MSLKEKLKNAFALEPEITLGTDELPAILEKFARKVVDKGMETPAILFLEMVLPLNFIGSQMVYAAVPIAGIFSHPQDLDDMAKALEHRGSIPKLVERIEQLSRKHT